MREAKSHITRVAVEINDRGKRERVRVEKEPGVYCCTIVGLDEMLFVVMNTVVGRGAIPRRVLPRSLGHAGNGGMVEELVLEVIECSEAEGEDATAHPHEIG